MELVALSESNAISAIFSVSPLRYELRRLHECVLARDGLRPSEFAVWKVRTESR